MARRSAVFHKLLGRHGDYGRVVDILSGRCGSRCCRATRQWWLLHHPCGRHRVIQPQRIGAFKHAAQAHKGGATATATTGQGRRCGIQIGQGVLPGIQGGDHVVDRSLQRLLQDGGFCGLGRLEQVGRKRQLLVFAHGQERHAIGLQLHGTSRGGHQFSIRSDAHAFLQHGQTAIAGTNPCLAYKFRHKNRGGCHIKNLSRGIKGG